MTSLSERLKQSSAAARAATPELGAAVDLEIYHQLKAALHARVVDRLDLSTLHQLSPDVLKQEIGNLLGQMVAEGTCRSIGASASRWCRSCSTRSPDSDRSRLSCAT